MEKEYTKELVINGKEYNYNLNRRHVFMLSKIIGKIDLEPDVSGDNDISIGVSLISQFLAKLYLAEIESLAFIASAYSVEENEIIEIGFQNEFILWKNIFDNEKDFFSKLFPSREKKRLNSSISSIPGIIAQS